jgi:hypothetical protein
MVPTFLSSQTLPLMDVLTLGLDAGSSERTRTYLYQAAPANRVPVTCEGLQRPVSLDGFSNIVPCRLRDAGAFVVLTASFAKP